MKSTFPGFPREGMAFLRALKKNNNREWFAPRKAVFETMVKNPMFELVSAIHGEMMRFAPRYVGDPAKCVHRIYRDTRFSKDKTPYKTFVSALFLRNGFDKYSGGAAYYVMLSPAEIEVAGGIYAPDREVLLAVREYIAENHRQFRATFETPRVRKLLGGLWGASLTRVPKGFDAGHPAADLIRRKHYVLSVNLDQKLATTPKLLPEIVRRIEAMTPFVEFLNRPLLARRDKQKREARFLDHADGNLKIPRW